MGELMLPQTHYEILLTDSQKKTYYDVNFCAFIRTPIIKQAGYCILRMHMPQLVIQQILNGISDNNFPLFTMKIYFNDESDNLNPEGKNKQLSLLYSQKLLCINARTDSVLDFKKNHAHIDMILVNPILYYMQTTNTYNNILENITAQQAINDFENFCTTNYGDIFSFNKVGLKSHQSSYVYEQILVKAVNDINVPTYLINTYKPNHTFNFYFFDNFYINGDTDNPITAHHINLADLNQFERNDIGKYMDSMNFVKKLKHHNFNDKSGNIIKSNETILFNKPTLSFTEQKNRSAKVPKMSSGQKDSIELMENRKVAVNTNESLSSIPISQSSFFTTAYTPDSENNAQERLNLALEYIREKFDCMYQYEMADGLPDFPQFGKVYNYDTDNMSEYIYTPINICNIFVRKNIKEHYLRHLTRFTMLKYHEGV